MDSCSGWLQTVVRQYKEMDQASLAVRAGKRLRTLQWVVCTRGMLMRGGSSVEGRGAVQGHVICSLQSAWPVMSVGCSAKMQGQG